jgi:hypothetical protein
MSQTVVARSLKQRLRILSVQSATLTFPDGH